MYVQETTLRYACGIAITNKSTIYQQLGGSCRPEIRGLVPIMQTNVILSNPSLKHIICQNNTSLYITCFGNASRLTFASFKNLGFSSHPTLPISHQPSENTTPPLVDLHLNLGSHQKVQDLVLHLSRHLP